MQAKLMAAARRNNLELSDAEIERINAIAKAYGEATRAAKEQEQALAAVREVGTIVARSLDQAFSTWTRGGKLDFRDMVDSMLRDLARLAFQMAVIRPLFGGGGSGNGVIGGLLGQFLGGGAGGGIGSWQTTSVPAMASGGTMSAGVPTLVGERGPELVLPRGGERVVPNHALGYGGGSPNVVVNITAPSGTSATETGRRGNADGGISMDILIETIDGALGQRLADGASTFGDAMKSTFGLGRAAGAR
jgi:phage-related minor tail protein